MFLVVLALHLGSPVSSGYSKLSCIRAPEWLAVADGYSKLGTLKTPEWLTKMDDGLRRVNRGPDAPAAYEKLGDLKAY